MSLWIVTALVTAAVVKDYCSDSLDCGGCCPADYGFCNIALTRISPDGSYGAYPTDIRAAVAKDQVAAPELLNATVGDMDLIGM